ncbi:MAG: alpha/beta hydrolase [Alphaproteobacteria bacterium]|nr:alpha/beta hydrolase [Alphaproteobacteria bacterium]
MQPSSPGADAAHRPARADGLCLVPVTLDGAEVPMAVRREPCETGPRLVWLHGWGQDHRAFAALASGLAGEAEHLFVDFPGFGSSPPPPGDWDSGTYARHLRACLATLPARPTALIGHSFGGRVIFHLASDPFEGFMRGIAIAGAGLRRRRSLRYRLRAEGLKRLGRLTRLADRLFGTKLHGAYSARFGSADYRKAGPMRGTLVKVVSEDLAPQARAAKVPLLFLYGEKDTETPPELGRRAAELAPGSSFRELPGLDHYSVLGPSAH